MNLSLHKTITKAEREEADSEKEEFGASKELNSNTGDHNSLELCLGIPSGNRSSILSQSLSFTAGSITHQAARAAVNDNPLNSLLLLSKKKMSGLQPSWPFSIPPNGFMDPWSLAARQQKAVLELAHKNTGNSSSAPPAQPPPRETPPPPPPRPPPPPPLVSVGWPPVCSYRRNMVSSQAARPEVEDERKTKRARFDEEEGFNDYDEAKGAMFVKVNMEGYAVGRKIDLKSHACYDSLSESLKKMFLNFLAIKCSEEYKVEASNHDFLLLYEDNEGDRMLVGDVPWEMFLASVKRLYIVRSPKPQVLAEARASSHGGMNGY